MAIKKGNRDGTTEFAHKDKPDFAALIFVFENIIKHIINMHKNMVKIFFFIFIV